MKGFLKEKGLIYCVHKYFTHIQKHNNTSELIRYIQIKFIQNSSYTNVH